MPARQSHSKRVQLTDTPVAHKFARMPTPGIRPPLAAALEDAVVAGDSARHGPAIVDGQTEWLLAVDVLPGGGRCYNHRTMPMIWSGNAHGVDIVTRQEFPEVTVAADAMKGARYPLRCIPLLDPVPGRRQAAMPRVFISGAPCVDVTKGNDLHLGMTEKGVHVHRSSAAQPDTAHGNSLARCRSLVRSQGRNRYNRGNCQSGAGGPLQQDRHHHRASPLRLPRCKVEIPKKGPPAEGEAKGPGANFFRHRTPVVRHEERRVETACLAPAMKAVHEALRHRMDE